MTNTRRRKPEKWSLAKAPPLLPETPDRISAADALAEAVLGGKSMETVKTPVGDVVVHRGSLEHIAENRTARREQYANFIRPTLEDPEEVWLAFYPEQREYRLRYLKAFEGDGCKFLAVARENADGISLTTFFRTDWRYIARQRRGALLYKRAGE